VHPRVSLYTSIETSSTRTTTRRSGFPSLPRAHGGARITWGATSWYNHEGALWAASRSARRISIYTEYLKSSCASWLSATALLSAGARRPPSCRPGSSPGHPQPVLSRSAGSDLHRRGQLGGAARVTLTTRGVCPPVPLMNETLAPVANAVSGDHEVSRSTFWLTTFGLMPVTVNGRRRPGGRGRDRRWSQSRYCCRRCRRSPCR